MPPSEAAETETSPCFSRIAETVEEGRSEETPETFDFP